MIAVLLGNIDCSQLERQITAYRRTIARWLEHDQRIKTQDRVMLMWPFVAAATIASRRQSGESLQQEQFVEIVEASLRQTMEEA